MATVAGGGYWLDAGEFADRHPAVLSRPDVRGAGVAVSVIYILLPVAVLFAAGALYLFIRSVRRGQFDDLDTPAIRITSYNVCYTKLLRPS